MQTNLSGRLRNTPLPKASGLLPLFEAAVNSIHAIEEAGIANEEGYIRIEILRDSRQSQLDLDGHQKKRGREALDEICEFRVTDNGVGFTDKNMRSFLTLDSDHKVGKGCRGVGRLLWLKAFERVTVESTFDYEGTQKKRSFVFDAESGVTNSTSVEVVDVRKNRRETAITLSDFKSRWRKSVRKTGEAIADNILEHCLWYFIREGGAPKITVTDGDEIIFLDKVYEQHMHTSAVPEKIEIKDRIFDLMHIKLRASSLSTHALAFCADNRLVIEEKLAGKILGLHGKIHDKEGDFIYSCYVSSDYLDEYARPERTGFDILDNVEGLFEETEIGLTDIRDAVVRRAREHLKPYLVDNIKRAQDRVNHFVSYTAPRYRPILPRIHEDQLNVDPEISDKDLDLVLHRHLVEIEGELLREGHDILTPQLNEEIEEYQKRVAGYLQKAEDVKKSDLASYVTHRRVIIDLLEKFLILDDNGKYAKEEMIHNLIMPMGKDSNEVFFDSCNLWIVDERLAFHDYLASDKTLSAMPITGSSETKEPDLCALNIFDNPMLVSEECSGVLASIVVVEIKRPMRNDAGEGERRDPIEQVLGYFSRIREGKVRTASGRPILNAENIPGYCYVICDITSTIERRMKMHDYTRKRDGLGYFSYHKELETYVEVISFDGLMIAAKERNRAFFDKLGLPAK